MPPVRPSGLQREFRLRAEVHGAHRIEASAFSSRGDLRAAALPTVRRLAAELGLDAGELYALGLSHEIQHAVVAAYERAAMAGSAAEPPLGRALAELDAGAPGRTATGRVLRAYAALFPSQAVATGERSVAQELAGSSDGRSHRAMTLEELLLTALANANPAARPLQALFDDGPLAAEPGYRSLLARLPALLPSRPGFGQGGLDLVGFLEQPARLEPRSLAAQLRWMRDHWPDVVAPFLEQLLLALDVLAEEARARELADAGRRPFGGGTTADIPDLAGLDAEVERFSADRDWMPRLVLLAKSTYVWLDQLSRTYGRDIHTLDAVPDEELAELARRGFTGLWLIGLWERSPASAEIKRRMGQPDAVASAYSLMDYRIAGDLGGEPAYADLRDRAARHGLRLASDMVPNHMGLDSSWVIEHPEWFLGLDAPPYPGYRFSGPDLSSEGRVEIRIEDGYWDRSDAAVVFERRERSSGATRYLYHGNDGTSMPWNDTAQLDYLQGTVREQVIQTILEVARRFPIIRFDAAMTLARRHIERLWYPEPGHGGAIPSRAEHALSRTAFLAAMPHEFWREVVDRVAAEVPGTLLLAEAFWLMEGYFVRTLGMHRVYNSAFMHMLRDERNAEYRALIAETLAYDPRILERYVDFMNNPDERTAVDQFGSGDKYAGVCTLLATLPGLPMFGHGQVEGFTEKYGMEYRRARQDEEPDPGLRALHEWRIFPLLRRRALFAGAESFRLFDVEGDGGGTLEDVFAYANRQGHERALVVYHNRYAEAHGWSRLSVPFLVAGQPARREALHEALALSGDEDVFYEVRDAVSHRQHLLSGAQVARQGFRVDLSAYGCRVLLDWREIRDPDGSWAALHSRLGDGSVEDLAAAHHDLLLEPIRAAYGRLIAPERARALRAALTPDIDAAALATFMADLRVAVADSADVLGAGGADAGRPGPGSSDAPGGGRGEVDRDRLGALIRHLRRSPVARSLRAELGPELPAWAGLVTLLVDAALADAGARTVDAADLDAVAVATLATLGATEEAARDEIGAIRTSASLPAGAPPAAWLADRDARAFLRVHDWEGTEWMAREPYEALVRWWAVRAWLAGRPPRPSTSALRRRGRSAGWQVAPLTVPGRADRG